MQEGKKHQTPEEAKSSAFEPRSSVRRTPCYNKGRSKSVRRSSVPYSSTSGLEGRAHKNTPPPNPGGRTLTQKKEKGGGSYRKAYSHPEVGDRSQRQRPNRVKWALSAFLNLPKKSGQKQNFLTFFRFCSF